MIHECFGHCGIEQTLIQLHEHFHWAGIKADVRLFVRCCDACQRRKLVLPDPPALQQPIIYGAFKHVHVDLAGPFEVSPVDRHPEQYATAARKPSGSSSNKHKAWVVLMVDYFTKVAEFGVVFTKGALDIAWSFWNGWVTRYGAPEFVTSDNGTEFGAEFTHMLARLGVEHIHTSVAHPAANGAVERLVQSLKDMLATHINNQQSHWMQSLPSVRFAYMNRLHTALGVSPNEMLMGCKLRLPVAAGDILGFSAGSAVLTITEPTTSEAHEHITQLLEKFEQLDVDALHNITKQFHNNLAKWQQKRAEIKHEPLKVGDLVLELLEKAPSTLHTAVVGPFRIVGFKDPQQHTALLTTGYTVFKKAKCFERHISRLVRYYDKNSINVVCGF
jgi:hypothetical protein